MAVDPARVVSAMPVVFDELNFIKNVHHHYRAYGGWSFALKDYHALGFTGAVRVLRIFTYLFNTSNNYDKIQLRAVVIRTRSCVCAGP